MRLRSPLILLTALLVLAGSVGPASAVPLVKVGVAYDSAGLGDMGFNDLVAEGAARAEADYGVKLFEKEMVKPSGKVLDGAAVLEKLAKKSELVVAVGFLYGDAVLEASANNPDTNFVAIDWGPSQPLRNVLGVFTADHEGAFLVGAAAGRASDSDHVGFLGGAEFFGIQRHEAGFVAGVKHVNPAATVTVDYIDSFTDAQVMYGYAMDMYESGIDVIYHAAGAAGYGLFAAAYDYTSGTGEHVWAIGVDVDQYEVVREALKPHILTSMLKNFDVVAYEAIKLQVHGTFEGGYEEWGPGVGAVDYSTSGGFVDDYVAELEAIKAEIIAGNIVVPTIP